MQSISRETNLVLTVVCLTSTVGVQQVQAQIITSSDGTGSIVTASGNRFDISGGKSGDGANLFHSFKEFGLSQNQTANFLSHPSIQNILARVTNGNASIINGLIKVTGGNSNLYLMNPAGIVFGTHASLNVPAAFTATTANGIGIGSHWFSASGSNDYSALVGNPGSFAFTVSQPGAIVNAGNLAVGQGQSLNLLGGTVINTGRLSAPGGQITMAAIPGSSLVQLRQPGQLLSLEVKAVTPDSSQPNSWVLPALSLPELLTGGNLRQATGIRVNSNGTVELTSGTQVNVDNGNAIVSGTLDASDKASGRTGGTVQILGRVKLIDQARIDVSGDADAVTSGGQVTVESTKATSGGISAQAASVVQQRLNIPTDNACTPVDTNAATIGFTVPEALKRHRPSTLTAANPCIPSITKGDLLQAIDNTDQISKASPKHRLQRPSPPEAKIISVFSKGFKKPAQ